MYAWEYNNINESWTKQDSDIKESEGWSNKNHAGIHPHTFLLLPIDPAAALLPTMPIDLVPTAPPAASQSHHARRLSPNLHKNTAVSKGCMISSNEEVYTYKEQTHRPSFLLLHFLPAFFSPSCHCLVVHLYMKGTSLSTEVNSTRFLLPFSFFSGTFTCPTPKQW